MTNRHQHSNPVSTVPKKDIVILLPYLEMMWSIYEIIHIWTQCGCRWKWRTIIALQRDANPWTPRIPVRRSINWATKPHIGSEINLLSSYLPWGVSEMMWSVYEIIHIWTAVVDDVAMCGFIARLVEHRTGILSGHGFESHWRPDFFRLPSFQLLKLEINCDDRSSLSLLRFAKPPSR